MKKSVLVCVLGLALTASLGATAESARPFKVIVNPGVVGRAVPRDVLAQIFLGQVQRWGNGSPISAVDLSSTSPVRQAFSEQILGRSVDAVKHHWLRRISVGQRPPLSRPSDEAVVAFVAEEPGAVGYVSVGTPLPESVREIVVQ